MQTLIKLKLHAVYPLSFFTIHLFKREKSFTLLSIWNKKRTKEVKEITKKISYAHSQIQMVVLYRKLSFNFLSVSILDFFLDKHILKAIKISPL